MASEMEPGQAVYAAMPESVRIPWGALTTQRREQLARIEREIARQAQEEMRERCAAKAREVADEFKDAMDGYSIEGRLTGYAIEEAIRAIEVSHGD